MNVDIPPHEVALIVHGRIEDLKATGWLTEERSPKGALLGIVFVSPWNEVLGVSWAPYADHARFVARDFRKHTAARILDVSPSRARRLKNEKLRGEKWDIRPHLGAEIPYCKSLSKHQFLSIETIQRVSDAKSGAAAPRLSRQARALAARAPELETINPRKGRSK